MTCLFHDSSISLDNYLLPVYGAHNEAFPIIGPQGVKKEPPFPQFCQVVIANIITLRGMPTCQYQVPFRIGKTSRLTYRGQLLQ